jgi:hypothetical protein
MGFLEWLLVITRVITNCHSATAHLLAAGWCTQTLSAAAAREYVTQNNWQIDLISIFVT